METKDLIIGAIIGAVLAYLFLGRTQTAQQSSMSNFNNYQLMQMQNRIQELEYQLKQNYHNFQQPMQQSTITPTGYKNNEKWLITRSKEGFIDNLEVVRDARFK